MEKISRLMDLFNMAIKYPTIHYNLMDEATNKAYKVLKEYPLKIEILRYFRGDQALWKSDGAYVKDPLNTIYFVLDGDGFLEYDGNRIPLEKGFAYLIPTNRSRIYGCKTFISKNWCFFQMRNSLGVDLLDGHPEIVNLGNFLKDKDFCDHFEKTTLIKTLRIQEKILEMLNAKNVLELCIERRTLKESKYIKVFQYIENNLSAKITISSLADTMNMTVPGFSRAFHRDLDQTIKGYMNNRLNQKACDLILLTDLKIKDIAHSLDYEDEYYFIRFFKKMNGIPPLQYRSRVNH
jgi:AraC-like DNA-binding protein